MAVTECVHLGDYHGHLADAQKVQQANVLARLFAHPLGRVDHQQGRVGAGGARDHVLQELPVSRGADENVIASIGTEPDSRRVDGKALVVLGPRGQRGARVVKEAADQGRPAMALMAHDGDLKYLARRPRHYVYPSARGRSNEREQWVPAKLIIFST